MKRILIIIAVIISAYILYQWGNSCPGKIYIGLAMDKMGITENTLNIHIDDKLKPHISIYWNGDNGTPIPDRILLYYRGVSQEAIPANYYGKNLLIIKTKSDSTLYNRIGLLKTFAYSKHNYKIDMRLKNDSLLIINWSIDNWYSDKTQMTDTLIFKDTYF